MDTADRPYGTKLPPSLVTVENGFTFNEDNLDDSDLSSMNTTPRADRKMINPNRLSPGEIDEADLGLKYSKANMKQPWQTTAKKSPPLKMVQVDGASSNDPRVSPGQENAANSRGRHSKIQDRKEKYRRMASPCSTRINSRDKLKGWKQAAEERQSKVSKPWYISNEEEEEDVPDDEVTPTKEAAPEQAPPRRIIPPLKNNAPEQAPPRKFTPPTQASPEQAPTTRALTTTSRSLFSSDSTDDEVEINKHVDMYGCPIFRVESEDSAEQAARTKLDQLDQEISKKETASSDFFHVSLFSSAMLEAKGVLEGAGQVVEELVLGPVPEEDEESTVNSSLDGSPKRPLKTPPRKITSGSNKASPASASSPTGSTSSWWVEEELGRRRRKKSGDLKTENADKDSLPSPPRRDKIYTNEPEQEEPAEQEQAEQSFRADSVVDGSFVLDDRSDVDVNSVLDDLSKFGKGGPPLVKGEEDNKATDDGEEEKEAPTSAFAVGLALIQLQLEEVRKHSPLNRIEPWTTSKVDQVEKPQVADSTNTVVADELKSEPALPDNSMDDGDVYNDTSKEAKGEALQDDAVSERKEEIPLDKTEDSSDEIEAEGKEDEVVALDAKAEKETYAYAEEVTVIKILGLVSESSVTGDTVDLSADSLNDDSAQHMTEKPDDAKVLVAGGMSKESRNATEPESQEDVESKEPTPLESSGDTRTDALDSHAVSAISAGAMATTDAVIILSEPADEPADAVKPDNAVPTEVEKKVEMECAPSKFTRPQSVRGMSTRSFPPTEDDDIVFDVDSIDSQGSEGTPVRANLNEETIAKKASKAKLSPPAPSPKEAVKSNSKPAMVKPLDDINGIPKGDIVLSLFNGNLNEANRAPKGADQVRAAILRMRSMRRRQEKVELASFEIPEPSAEKQSPTKRSALPVDVDDMRVVGGYEHVKTLEQDAIEHLKHDDFEAALELYDDIIIIYAETFKESEKARKKSRPKSPNAEKDESGFRSYTGAALHNIGILHLLLFDFKEALSFFNRAAASRKIHFGAGSIDYLTSLEKIAICHYALDNYEEAHKGLEEVLELSKNHLEGLSDFMQIAEVLNNLGCLSFMCGQSGEAMNMFRECLEIQNSVLKQSLYGGPVLGGQSTSLSISVTRGNIGYIRMLTKNASAAMVEFEASLMHQQMILSDSHDTVICTMDHLAVANLLADKKELALKMLSRMLRAQLDAYGPGDERCVLTLSKLQLVQTQDSAYLEKALEQLWKQHTTASSGSPPKGVNNKKSKGVLKKFSFRKKAAKLNTKQ